MPPNQKWTDSLEPKIKEAREKLQLTDPGKIATDAGVVWVGGGDPKFEITFFGQPYAVSWPDLVVCQPDGQICSNLDQAFLLQYLLTADATPFEESWVSLGGLPNGSFYEQAYQGYSGNVLARAFRRRPEDLKRAAEAAGGERLTVGDLSFRYLALPRIPLALVYWSGGEEFPDSAQVLFDRSASHYHHVEMLAHLGSLLCQKVIAAGKALEGVAK
ncbi:MAG: DUF3786 domain-containing protein [Acidobacteria bacterium]|nr:MAG: DUF3786 domain-containing protein [Acidobacteriota bacterium]